MSFAKILIEGEIEIVTGLHIGGPDQYSAIGAVDSPVVRDSITRNPIIPGSSLKGKLRSLLQKTYGASNSHNQDDPKVLRLFGSSNKDNQLPSRLIFSDCFMCRQRIEELQEANIRITEVKTENTIDRKTSVANPRQIERVIRGAIFNFELIYDVLLENKNEISEDLKNISKAMNLLEHDSLGGHGSRGSGKIKFKDMKASVIYSNMDVDLETLLKEINMFTTQNQD